MSKGVRMLNGIEYLLAGRFDSLESAQSEKQYWVKARVIKLGFMDYGLYVHGGRRS